MSSLIIQLFPAIHMLIIWSLTITMVNPYNLLKSVELSPSNREMDGVRVMTNINEVTTINEQWHVHIASQNQWQFIIFVDSAFSFDEYLDSTISITLNTNHHLWNPGSALLFGFTSTNTHYISATIPLSSTNHPNQIYPACDQSVASTQLFASGDIAALPKYDRSCDIAAGSCANWRDMMPINNALTAGLPITFTLENHPDTHTFSLHLEANSFPTDFRQTCQFGATFPANNMFKIYIAGNDPSQSYAITSFVIESAIKYPTAFPTLSPTLSPSKNPTLSPTKAPTKNPSVPPTRNPTLSPTKNPSQSPTNRPSVSPTKNPTASPTKNPTSSPTKNPSVSPTNNPTNQPSVSPTKYPTASPTKTPSVSPSNPPTMATLSPTTGNPTAYPSTSPTANPTTAAPTPRPVPYGFEWGPHDNLCPITNEGLLCSATQDILAASDGIIACNLQPYDCCMCARIECGVGSKPCTDFRVGTAGIYGVKDIVIVGSADGVLLACEGEESCKEARIEASNVESVHCDGFQACQNAKVSITDPKQSFVLECTGYVACEGLALDIHFSAPPAGFECNPNAMKSIFELSKIVCNEFACNGMQITINNAGCDEVIIKNLECLQPDACVDAVFNLMGDVTIENCQCGASCNSAVGLTQCYENLDSMLCSDAYSCQGQSKTITNPAEGFQFICGDLQSCENANFVIELSDVSNVVQSLGAFLMGGEFSARGATFTIENKQGFKVFIGKIECGGIGSCEGTTFITGTDVLIENIVCGADACFDCIIKPTINARGLPCDPSQIRSIRPFGARL